MSIFFYGCITLDGYLAGKSHELDWLHQTGAVEETGYDSFYETMDATVMGRRTFEELAKQENPSIFYPTTQNYVFTHRPLTQEGFTAVSGDVVSFAKETSSHQNLWVIGGNTILAPLLNQNLVDYLILQIAPVLLGEGIPLFTQEAVQKRFRLEEVRKYGQFAELTYHKP